MEPRVFVGREEEVKFFKKKLEEAKIGRCDHFLVLGDWGIGKTTLLKEFKNIAQEKGILTSLVTISNYDEDSHPRDGVKELITEIPHRLPITSSKLKNYMRHITELGIQILGTGFNFSRSIEGMLPQPLLLDTLTTLWKDLKDKSEVIVVLLDDVQNFSAISGIFTILKNVLSDEEIVKGTRFLFALSCTPDAWRQFLVRHHPIGRYFTPRLKLERLTKEKTLKALESILEGTGVTFAPQIKQLVYEYTEGHPYELQVLCSRLYENQFEGEVAEKVWDISLGNALLELGEVVFDAIYTRASLQEAKVLFVTSQITKPLERKKISLEVVKYFPDISEEVVYTLVGRLTDKRLLASHFKAKYAVFDRLFAEYVKRIKGYDGQGAVIKKTKKTKRR